MIIDSEINAVLTTWFSSLKERAGTICFCGAVQVALKILPVFYWTYLPKSSLLNTFWWGWGYWRWQKSIFSNTIHQIWEWTLCHKFFFYNNTKWSNMVTLFLEESWPYCFPEQLQCSCLHWNKNILDDFLESCFHKHFPNSYFVIPVVDNVGHRVAYTPQKSLGYSLQSPSKNGCQIVILIWQKENMRNS